MIIEREPNARIRLSMERREAMLLISELTAAIGKSIGAYPIATVSAGCIEIVENGKTFALPGARNEQKRGAPRVLLITVDPDLHEPTTIGAKKRAKEAASKNRRVSRRA